MKVSLPLSSRIRFHSISQQLKFEMNCRISIVQEELNHSSWWLTAFDRLHIEQVANVRWHELHTFEQQDYSTLNTSNIQQTISLKCLDRVDCEHWSEISNNRLLSMEDYLLNEKFDQSKIWKKSQFTIGILKFRQNTRTVKCWYADKSTCFSYSKLKISEKEHRWIRRSFEQTFCVSPLDASERTRNIQVSFFDQFCTGFAEYS